MSHIIIAVVIGGIAVLYAVLFWFMPGLTRRDLYFAVTVAPGFRDKPAGESILSRYRTELVIASALAFISFFAGVAWFGIGFVTVGFLIQNCCLIYRFLPGKTASAAGGSPADHDPWLKTAVF